MQHSTFDHEGFKWDKTVGLLDHSKMSKDEASTVDHSSGEGEGFWGVLDVVLLLGLLAVVVLLVLRFVKKRREQQKLRKLSINPK